MPEDQRVKQLEAGYDELRTATNGLLRRAESAEQSLAEQRKDAERLDWLDKNRAETIKTGSGPVRVFYVQGKPGGPTSIREVIDAAIGSPVSAIREFSSTDKRSSEQTPPSAEQKD